MFKPLRFNALLKAVPGLAHLQHTPNSKTHQHVSKSIDVDKIRFSEEEGTKTHVHAHVTKDVENLSHTEAAAAQVHTKVKTEVSISTKQVEIIGVDKDITHVHTTVSGVTEIEMTPPHPPREDTPIYLKTHNHLVNKLDSPCAICGVRKSTLHIAAENLFKAKDIETHHYPVERCLLNACDPKKVAVIFPQVKNHDSLEAFIDSEENMMVLCDIHHRHPLYGIHHLVGPDFSVQPFLFGGYQVVATSDTVEKVRVMDETIVKRHIKDKGDLYGEQITKTVETTATVVGHKAAATHR